MKNVVKVLAVSAALAGGAATITSAQTITTQADVEAQCAAAPETCAALIAQYGAALAAAGAPVSQIAQLVAYSKQFVAQNPVYREVMASSVVSVASSVANGAATNPGYTAFASQVVADAQDIDPGVDSGTVVGQNPASAG
ncbi:hypothetical protein HCZ30_06465 [Marivivens donghaensis]|uniref:Hemophore-related protein n=1 Tax=Marivivens donghaensis TaxID=1699413 RepID=A0ABX0VXY9_9RHOB|nr:hypothetical protein [Marivivens donghaensis]NIY72077.1 hypothetical protein [Marivivens donghaensis]